MHECPECFRACDCDGEDTWFENVTACVHECECYDYSGEDQFEDEYDESDEEYHLQAPSPTLSTRLKMFRAHISFLWSTRVISFCWYCHKPDSLFGKWVGNHFDCDEIPF